ncbi:uncharacterized protein LOC134554996 isoform X3 [Prinia subflava]|uniref:uncharacterized protein LOC134554996 isoform X3 n=1 Tax=Prinia subflava TaxID=208062 RepID=UPI002FE296F0
MQESSRHEQGDATCERAESEAVENELCTSDESVREPLGSLATSAPGSVHRRILRGFPGKRFRCRAVPVLVLVVLVLLVLALAVALAVQSGIPAPGSRVRNGAPSSGPPWPLSRMRTWVCSSASTGTSITGSGCADGASACTGGTAATSAPALQGVPSRAGHAAGLGQIREPRTLCTVPLTQPPSTTYILFTKLYQYLLPILTCLFYSKPISKT